MIPISKIDMFVQDDTPLIEWSPDLITLTASSGEMKWMGFFMLLCGLDDTIYV